MAHHILDNGDYRFVAITDSRGRWRMYVKNITEGRTLPETGPLNSLEEAFQHGRRLAQSDNQGEDACSFKSGE